jgi:hypothetical protein
MRIGDKVTYNGRRYAVAGFTPLSVIPFRVELVDAETNESFWIEWPPKPVERAALRAVSTSDEDEEDGEQPATSLAAHRVAR